jgi:5-methylcytosine-specific restriction enzyme subunit McrC
MAENNIELFEYETCSKEVDLNKIDLKYFSTEWKNSRTFLKAQQYVGVAQFGDLRVTVYPKIYWSKETNIRDEKDKQYFEFKNQSMQNFLFMLQYVLNFDKIKNYESSTDLFKNDSFLEIFIYFYARYLFDLLKVNLNCSYIVVEDEIGFLKGSWRLSEQLSKAPHLKHKFHVSYDEFTENNELNRILKFVTGMLVRISKNSRNITLLQNILLVYAEVDDIAKPNKAYCDKVKFNRMNKDFKNVFELAKMFLEKLIGDYSSTKTFNFTFMFDMNLLFEQFIAEFIKRENLTPNNWKIKTKAHSKYLTLENKFQLIPDILFLEGDINKLILDTKYKQLNRDSNDNYGISQSDAYQMYAYSTKYKCERVILLYPQFLGKSEVLKTNFKFEHDKNLLIRTVSLCRDLNKSKEKENLKDEIKCIIKN